MNRAFQLLILLIPVICASCGGARLSHDEIRRQVADLGTSTLVPSAVAIRRVVSQSGNRAIAETTVDLAVQLERDSTGSPWHITSIRLGDQNWVPVDELIAALNETKKKVTQSSMEKLSAGIASYRQRNGSAPAAGDIKALGDVLHPQYMKDLVLEDGWGRLFEVEAATPTFRFRSLGPDGQRGTSDDLVSP
jgi:type II secretion system (T2SS) protein G